jgi:hypothetical protein
VESSSLPVEQLSSGLTLERLSDEQIFAFTLADITRATINAWVQAVKELTANRPREDKYFALNHFSGKNVSLTPYLRAAIKDLSDWKPEMSGCIALVVPKTFFAQLMTLFLPMMNRGNMQSRIYFTRQEALDWLEKMRAKDQTSIRL